MTMQIQTPADARRAEHREIVSLLEAYVGDNWRTHYQGAFEDLLEAERTGDAGLTWNWPAALFPLWFLYRRLPLAFFGFVAAHAAIAAGAVVSGWLIAYPALLLLLVLYRGYLADRLLFRKAIRAVRRTGDRALLARQGAPIVWAPLAYVAVTSLVPVTAYLTLGTAAVERLERVAATALAREAGPEGDRGPAFLFSAQEAPPSPVGEKVFTAADGHSRITVPDTWTEMGELDEVTGVEHDLAGISVGNTVLDQYALVVSDDRSDLENVDLARYARLRLAPFQQQFRNVAVSEPRSLTVDGKPAIQYHLRGTLPTSTYIRVTMWLTAIEGADRFHLVTVSTRNSLAQLADPVQKSILESFRELPGKPAAAGE